MSLDSIIVVIRGRNACTELANHYYVCALQCGMQICIGIFAVNNLLCCLSILPSGETKGLKVRCIRRAQLMESALMRIKFKWFSRSDVPVHTLATLFYIFDRSRELKTATLPIDTLKLQCNVETHVIPLTRLLSALYLPTKINYLI